MSVNTVTVCLAFGVRDGGDQLAAMLGQRGAVLHQVFLRLQVEHGALHQVAAVIADIEQLATGDHLAEAR